MADSGDRAAWSRSITAAQAGVLDLGEDAALMLGAMVTVAAVVTVTRPVPGGSRRRPPRR